jgi:hypothetical protein
MYPSPGPEINQRLSSACSASASDSETANKAAVAIAIWEMKALV